MGFAQMHDQQSVKMERQIAEELMKVGKRWWGGDERGDVHIVVGCSWLLHGWNLKALNSQKNIHFFWGDIIVNFVSGMNQKLSVLSPSHKRGV